MTFKDLQKLLVQSSQSNPEQAQLFERLRNKPFWIWDREEHKVEDIKTKGYCCFNHIIGLAKMTRMRSESLTMRSCCMIDYQLQASINLQNTTSNRSTFGLRKQEA